MTFTPEQPTKFYTIRMRDNPFAYIPQNSEGASTSAVRITESPPRLFCSLLAAQRWIKKHCDGTRRKPSAYEILETSLEFGVCFSESDPPLKDTGKDNLLADFLKGSLHGNAKSSFFGRLKSAHK
jgi:hypothetical protein